MKNHATTAAAAATPPNGGDVPPERLLVAARRGPGALARRARRQAGAERRRDDDRRQREHEPEEASPAALANRRVDLEVDRIVGLAAKPRVRVRREKDVGADLCRVADVRRDEAVQAVGHLSLDEHGEPVDEADDGRGDSAKRQPDEERDREEEAEERPSGGSAARSSRTTSRTGRCSMVAIGAFSRMAASA